MNFATIQYVNKKFKELFQSVSNGKSLIASAITDKGVNTQEDATFSQMATNIRAIQTGGTGITPSGTKTITSNGTHDVTSYANADVNVPIPSGYIKPSGTKTITENGTHDVTNYANVEVNVESSGGSASGSGKAFHFTLASKVSTGTFVTFLEADADIAAHKDDSTLCVSFYNVTPPSGVAVLGGMHSNSPISANNIYGCVLRQTSAGAMSPSSSSFTKGLRAELATIGGIAVTDNGGIKICSGGTQYPLNEGEYIVSVSW